jgi:hypothetical protein
MPAGPACVDTSSGVERARTNHDDEAGDYDQAAVLSRNCLVQEGWPMFSL